MAGKPARQKGVVTTFTGILILVLLTLMMFFAFRVGGYEQRVSSYEMRQKLAFHAAESGIHHAKEFLRANIALIPSRVVDMLPDGSDGWLSATAEGRWQRCADVSGLDLDSGHGSHPCYGEAIVDQRANTYFYSFNGSTELPIDTDAILPGTTEQVAVQALLCVLDVVEDAEIPVQGCVTDPAAAVGVGDGTYFLVTLLARGEADCDGGNCAAEALVSEKVSNYGAAAGGNNPAVPLTTRSSFPPSGTAEVVANPNAGGVGVPISVWMNGNTCGGGAADPSGGSWATCEYQEWYGVDIMPDDIRCPGNCSCSFAESISNSQSSTPKIGIDLVLDPVFPCDLFQYYFGVPRANYEIVKGYAKIVTDCSVLGPNSFGIYWLTGPDCRVNSNTVIGSPEAPVLLITAATSTRFNGGSSVFGSMYITDVEDPNATFESQGNNIVYGSVIVDSDLGSYTGTFQVVWNEYTSRKAGIGGGLGTVPGGWSDFHRDWR